MPQLNAKPQEGGKPAGARKTSVGSDRSIKVIDPICNRPVPQSELAETRQRRAVILAELAPFLAKEVRHDQND